MTEPNRSRAERERVRANICAEIGITPYEATLFSLLHYGLTLPPADFVARAANPNYSLVEGASEADFQTALADCLAKGWLQVIDETALANIVDELRAGGMVGPIYGLPIVGVVDVTMTGASFWQRFAERWPPEKYPPHAYTDVVHIKTAHCFRNESAALAAIAKYKNENDAASITGPCSIGPWRAQWWRRFPEGYRIDIEERMQWQGRASGGGEWCDLSRSPQGAERQQLRRVLDQHNVTRAEWILLASRECAWRTLNRTMFPWWLAEFAERECGATISEAEHRDALEACLRYGWLRVMDQRVFAEIQALLQTDPAHLAVPRIAAKRPRDCGHTCVPFPHGKLVPVPIPVSSQWGEIDFTPEGAALYRRISTAWLGTGWEDSLRVSREYIWEEHHYCAVEEGFELILQEHVAKGELVRASRIVPIGSWCVYWWERFPAGYRLELEIVDG